MQDEEKSAVHYSCMRTEQVAAVLPILDPLPKIAIVRSEYYEDLLTMMENEARNALGEAGIPQEYIQTISVPGAFEIPLACQTIAPKVDGIIALGVIVQGQTHHAEEIARGCTDGLMHVQMQESIPIAHEVLYVHSREQAEARTSKGKEAATTLLRMMKTLRGK